MSDTSKMVGALGLVVTFMGVLFWAWSMKSGF